MSAKHQYIVTGFGSFKSLDDAKWNVRIGFTRSEALRFLVNEAIYHFIGDKLYSETPIKVDESGNISFGKTYKVI